MILVRISSSAEFGVNEKQTQQDSNIVENSIESKIRRYK